LKESSSSGEEIEEVIKPTLERDKDIPSIEDNETLAPTTRSQTKKSLLPATTELEQEKGSNAVTTQPFKTSNLQPEDLQEKLEANTIDSESLPELDPTSEEWTKLHKAAYAQLGGIPIHGKDDNKVQQILRVFDNSHQYGPCIGMTRLERWERAESLGLNPPKEIYEILMTKQGQALDEYKQSVFHGEV